MANNGWSLEMQKIWIMKTATGFYPIAPTSKCKPQDHGLLNDHVTQIEDMEGNVLWRRETGDV